MFTRRTLHDLVRPFFGLVLLQPIVIPWFIIMADDWQSDYMTLGWPLQIICTIWMVPCYSWYERHVLTEDDDRIIHLD